MLNKDCLKMLSTSCRISVDFISPLLISVFLGIILDKWLLTHPIFFIIFLALGFCSSVLNTYRIAKSIWGNKNNAG
ncbi:MAG: AtpZ/AtpI family protein [Alphaproteobacteria bacterium]